MAHRHLLVAALAPLAPSVFVQAFTEDGRRGDSPSVAALACDAARGMTPISGVALAVAQPGSRDSLINQLREGGLVLLMRHASSPREVPSKANANPDNTRLERQLDESGRRASIAMGTALRRLRIPIGTVLSIPTYRALETVRLARLDNPTAVDELGDGGQSMQGISDAQAAWLRSQAGDVPTTGNTIVVTHLPNLTRAFPDWGSTVADGETVVLRPDGHGKNAIVGRIPIERWPELR